MSREELKGHTRFVVKIGSSLLARDDLSVNEEYVADVGRQLAEVRDRCRQLVLVSSGAVSAGLSAIGWKSRPADLIDLHVAAAVGQIGLFSTYERVLSPLGFRPAQMLMTAEELSDRSIYLNARLTLLRLQEIGFLPVVNEDDAIANRERRFGDNDRLAAELTNLLEANLLVILTDVEGLYSDLKGGVLLEEGDATDPSLREHLVDESGTELGSGGMTRKLDAARIAANSGAHCVIADGRAPDVICRILAGENVGTLLRAPQLKMRAKERWLATCAKARGSLMIDKGAAKAVCRDDKSLLPVGVIGVTGTFERGDVVECVAPDGTLVAQGMVNYGSHEMAQIARKQTDEIEGILGHLVSHEAIHKDNLVSLVD